jgi:sensor c-di-GMP phosphodiesterase-like protein
VALGLSIALDDFGTGYSNLAYLQRFPIHTLKIDKAFVDELPGDRALAEFVVELCRLLRLTAVAEGVETTAQRGWLRQRGVPQYQGFLFAPPMPAPAFEALLTRAA